MSESITMSGPCQKDGTWAVQYKGKTTYGFITIGEAYKAATRIESRLVTHLNNPSLTEHLKTNGHLK